MDYYIFDNTETLIDVRSDAVEFIHTEEEFKLNCEFPISDYLIERGMFIGFYDILDVFQLFEVRTPKNTFSDKSQDIYAEHVALADLMDDIIEPTTLSSVTAEQAGTSILTNTRWQIGTSVTTGTDDVSAYYVTAWNALITIRDTFTVRIKPRLVLGTTTITARYIDLESRTPVFRGVRLTTNKNLQKIGITYDDTTLYTALYGRGAGLSTLAEDDTNAAKLTFEDVVWTVAGGDDADKPSGQQWVEDTAATAIYGRGGRKRTGVVEFSDIEDADELLQATWDYLQTVKYPQITINSTILDLYSLGYDDELMLLGDSVAVIDDDLGIEAYATIVSMPRNYVKPEKSKPVIGYYRPGLDYRVAETITSAGTVTRMTNSNSDLVNGFSTNLNGADGTLSHLTLLGPSETYYRFDFGEFTVYAEGSPYTLSGMTWGTDKDSHIGASAGGGMVFRGIEGIQFSCPSGKILNFSVGLGGAQMYMNNYRMDLTGDMYITGNCSAESFTDRTPGFNGDALAAIAKIKTDKKGNIDHASLPDEARKKVKVTKYGKDKKIVKVSEEDGRDIGMMVCLLTEGLKQLIEELKLR
ncbi:MAG TPA: phage tail spike protein [Clostridia bacterium]|nr:phage tail spike protein [Clostridia bacterium]